MLQAPSSSGNHRSFPIKVKEKLFCEPGEHAEKPNLIALTLEEADFLTLRRKLLKLSVIDTQYNWKLSNHHIVLFIDKLQGETLAECLWLIYSLEEKANIGNCHIHTLLNPAYPLESIYNRTSGHPRYSAASKAVRRPPIALYQGNREILNWLKTKNVIERIGNTLFFHGNLFACMHQPACSIPQLNARFRTGHNNGSSTEAFPPAGSNGLPMLPLNAPNIVYAAPAGPVHTAQETGNLFALPIQSTAVDKGANFPVLQYSSNTLTLRYINSMKRS